MTTIREDINSMLRALDKARISQATRGEVERIAARVTRRAGALASGETEIANPLVDPESYGGRYYWQTRDRETARTMSRADVTVDAVRIDSELDSSYDTPSGWYPRVEVTFTVKGRQLVGDLTAAEARGLALELLSAAEVVDR